MLRSWLFNLTEKVDKLLDNVLIKIEKIGMFSSGLSIVIITLLAALNRYILKIKGMMCWSEEAIIFLYMLLVFWGASHVARED